MRRATLFLRVVTAAAVIGVPALLIAQQRAEQSRPSARGAAATDLSTAKPGRDPNQAIDEEYTKKIKEYTTEPFFLSPLVDYLPASKTVPTPKAVLGDIAGAPGKLPYSKEVYDYMRLLAKATPRVKVVSIGKTEEGREMIAVAVASEALMARLDGQSRRSREARRSATHQHERRAGGRDRPPRRAGLLHHRDDSLARSGRADGADGARVPARRGREPLHPAHPRQPDHADHAGRRSRRPRSRGRSLQLHEEVPGSHGARISCTGASTSRTTTTATRWA